MHLFGERRLFAGDDLRRKAGQEGRLQFGACAVDADLLVRHGCQQQEAVVRNAAAAHVGLDDAGRLADRIGQLGAVRPDDQRQIGHVQEIEAASEADHPLAMLDIHRTLHPAHLGDMREIACQQRQQVMAHLLRHVGEPVD